MKFRKFLILSATLLMLNATAATSQKESLQEIKEQCDRLVDQMPKKYLSKERALNQALHDIHSFHYFLEQINMPRLKELFERIDSGFYGSINGTKMDDASSKLIDLYHQHEEKAAEGLAFLIERVKEDNYFEQALAVAQESIKNKYTLLKIGNRTREFALRLYTELVKKNYGISRLLEGGLLFTREIIPNHADNNAYEEDDVTAAYDFLTALVEKNYALHEALNAVCEGLMSEPCSYTIKELFNLIQALMKKNYGITQIKKLLHSFSIKALSEEYIPTDTKIKIQTILELINN